MVRNGFNDLQAENPERDAFSADEIALSALAHFPRYMKRRQRNSRLLSMVGIHRGDLPKKAPGRFKMPKVSIGLGDLTHNGELAARFEDDDGQVAYDPENPSFTEKPANLGKYRKMYFKPVSVTTGEVPVASNGNGAVPGAQIAEQV
jgi:hypothetical protein